MLNLAKNNLVVIDVETSGVNPFKHEVLAIGIVPLIETIPPCLVYIRPLEIEWSTFARNNFDKFSTEWEEKAIPPSEACRVIEKYLAEVFNGQPATVIGHNVGFDIAFLRKLAFLAGKDEIAGISHRMLDTHTMLYLLYLNGLIPSTAMRSDEAFKHFSIKVNDAERHTALGDAIATRELVLKLFKMLRT